MNRLPTRGLYALLNASDGNPQQLGEYAANMVLGGAVLLQYRAKSGTPQQRRRGAEAVLNAAAAIPVLINDNVGLAAQLGAAGVHLGRGDTSIAQARQRLGPKSIIGATCHDSLAWAEQAIAAGADYVSFGRFFASRTKPQAPPADINVLTQARARFDVPIVAIGGINADNGAQLIAAGADFLSVSGGLFVPPDCRTAAQHITDLFKL